MNLILDNPKLSLSDILKRCTALDSIQTTNLIDIITVGIKFNKNSVFSAAILSFNTKEIAEEIDCGIPAATYVLKLLIARPEVSEALKFV